MRYLPALLLIALAACATQPDQTPGSAAIADVGYIHGADHCFHFGKPAGWVVDGSSGRDQGLTFVFYPDGETWADAPVAIYARVASKTDGRRTPAEQVARTLDEFRQESPTVKAVKIGSVKAAAGVVGDLYKFSGDKFGSAELVAYFSGKDTLNFFVMTSRTPEAYAAGEPALMELAASYREADDCKPCCQRP